MFKEHLAIPQSEKRNPPGLGELAKVIQDHNDKLEDPNIPRLVFPSEVRLRWAVRFWNPLLCVLDLLFTERSCAKKGMVVAKKGSFGSCRIVLGLLECFRALNYPDMG